VKKLDDKLASGGVASTNHVFFVSAATVYCFEEVSVISSYLPDVLEFRIYIAEL
jgi:hypothetical protein